MRNWKIFIISILILGAFNACKHEFEEGTHWSWYTKAELINRRGLFLEIIKASIDGAEIANIPNCDLGCPCQIYVRSVNYVDFSSGGQASRAVDLRMKYTRIKNTVELGLVGNECILPIRGEWKILNLTKDVFIVKRIYNGKEYKIWFK